MLAHGFRDRAEDDAGFVQLLLEGRDDRNAIEHGIDRDARRRHARQNFLLLERNAELFVSLDQLRIDVGEALRPLRRFRRRIVIKVLKIDLRIMDPRPSRLRHGLPALERFETPSQKPLGLALLGRDEAHGRFIKPLRSFDALDAGLKTVFVLVDIDLLDLIDRLLNSSHFLVSLSTTCRSLRQCKVLVTLRAPTLRQSISMPRRTRRYRPSSSPVRC